MQVRFWVMLLFFVSFVAGQQKPERDVFADCDNGARTQAELNECARRDDASADDDMNRTYQELLKRAASDPLVVKKIETAQRAWIAFREAQIAALYPAEDKMEYGTVFPMCVNLVRADLTRQRTKMLKEMLQTPVEGDVCAAGYPEPSR